ncbi:hypothetical protein QWZ16_17155 [Vibrio ostreicida]|uniref:Uncharacterized protein n=1 Tax=Vibrio ostreicida TaxID=526588 RepID=A0ABT8BY62_9VIBR|nr:hypothetical protein [Vibrio ostreicida]MDN3611331.1 hypothetical protein [Vibrio ostreicida]
MSHNTQRVVSRPLCLSGLTRLHAGGEERGDWRGPCYFSCMRLSKVIKAMTEAASRMSCIMVSRSSKVLDSCIVPLRCWLLFNHFIDLKRIDNGFY